MLPDGIRRLFRLGRAKDVAAEVDAELAFHLETKTQSLIARGMSPEAARAEAVRQFGDVRAARAELVRADTDDTATRARGEWWNDWWMDVRYALKSLRHTPGVAAAVMTMLALGIGANASMFGILDKLFLTPPPHIVSPGNIVRFWVHSKGFQGREFNRDFGDFHEYDVLSQLKSVSAATGFGAARLEDLGRGASAERAAVSVVTGNFFTFLGVHPTIGRLISAADDSAGATPASVIGYRYWKRRFGGSSSVLGATLIVDDVTYTVVGVTPDGFSGPDPDAADVWLPVQIAGPAGHGPRWQSSGAGGTLLTVLARLRPGISSLAAADEATNALRAHYAEDRYTDPQMRVLLGSILRARVPWAIGPGLRLALVVGGVALAVLIIACANTANLLLLRAARRQREIAVRQALGAGAFRIMRMLVVESVLLAVVAGAAAFVVAAAGTIVLRRALLPRYNWAAPVLDLRVLAFATLSALLIGLVTAALPSWRASRSDAIADLKAGAHAARRARSRARSALLVVQAALSLVLLVGAALFARSFDDARHFDLGFDIGRLLVVGLYPVHFDRRTSIDDAKVESLVDRIRRLPGVAALATSSGGLMTLYQSSQLQVPGRESVPAGEAFYLSAVSANYFDVAGLKLARGRAFTDRDRPGAPKVAVVNAETARLLFPGEEAVGKCLLVNGDKSECTTIVGVLKEARERGLNERLAPLRTYYVPMWQDTERLRYSRSVLVRVRERPDDLVPQIQRAVSATFPDLPSDRVLSLPTLFEPQIRPWRVGVGLFTAAGALALFLAAVGLYSVVAFTVRQRQFEFGIRRALGAQAWDLLRLVLLQSLTFAVAGLALGIGLSLWGSRFVAPLLFEGRSPRDPLALAVAGSVLLGTSIFATIAPALAATRADPRQALQAD